MTTASASRRARRLLDARLQALTPASRFTPPRAGWVRAIRDALGMSAAELANRMGVARQAVSALEATEVDGGARLSTLRRAAEAMNCTLVYAFIPNSSLQATVEEAAARLLDAQLKQVSHSMALEDQAVELGAGARQDAIDDLIASGTVWSTARPRSRRDATDVGDESK